MFVYNRLFLLFGFLDFVVFCWDFQELKETNEINEISKEYAKIISPTIKQIITKKLVKLKGNSVKSSKKLEQILSTKIGKDFVIEKSKELKENKKLWFFALQKNDLSLLFLLKSTGINMTLTNTEINSFIDLNLNFYSFNEFQLILFLVDYSDFDDDFVYKLLIKVLNDVRFFPYLDYQNYHRITKEQQEIQFKIVKQLANKYQILQKHIKSFLADVILTLNIQLVDFVIKTYHIDINEMVGTYKIVKTEFINNTFLQCVISYLFYCPDRVYYSDPNYHYKNINFAYEMLFYLLGKGIDLEKPNWLGMNSYSYLELIQLPRISTELLGILTNFNSTNPRRSIRMFFN